MVEEVFIPLNLVIFREKKKLKSHLVSIVLMSDEYPLNIINEIVSMIGFLWDLLYTYKCKKIITSDTNDLYNYSWRRSIAVYHIGSKYSWRKSFWVFWLILQTLKLTIIYLYKFLVALRFVEFELVISKE